MEPAKLEAAKERLKVALKRLEKTLDKRLREAEIKIAQAGTAPAQGKTATPDKALLADIDTLKKQLKHIEEENQTLRHELGAERDETKTLRRTQEEVAARMDGVISQVKEVLQRQEA